MDEDLELFEQSQQEVEQLETLPPANVELPALQALAAVVLIQVTAAKTTHPLLPIAIEAAEQLQSCFDQQSAIYKMLQIGWDEPPDLNNEAYKVLAAVAKRPRRLSPRGR